MGFDSNIKKIILICFLFLVSCFLFLLWWGIYLPKNLAQTEARLFLIERGQSLFQISKNLQNQGLIRNKFFFEIYVIYKGKEKNLQAGGYFLDPAMTIPEMTEKFVSGEVIKEKITIIEGWNLRNIGWYFENKGIFQAEELFELVGFPTIDYSKNTDLPQPKDFSEDYDFLKDKSKNVSLEGYLFPDTYQINKGENIEGIVRKMLDNFGRKLTPDLREEIARQGKIIFDAVRMASLIEKEVKTKDDRELVSGILWKRLKQGIPLQVDATITYLTGKKTTQISKEETQIDSPYNTYKYNGLPLGPICNPGLESILAALYPKDSEFWYYLSTPEGKTIFSKTLEEHNIAKAKYLK